MAEPRVVLQDFEIYANGCSWRIEIIETRYVDSGRIALLAKHNGEDFAMITCNLPLYVFQPGEFAVKTWTENAWVPQLLASGLFIDTGKTIPTGFVQAPIWRMVK